MGRWGALLISVGLLVSVGGALLAWLLLCAEILSATSRAGAMPRVFGDEPRPGVPRTAILITTAVLQVALVWAHYRGSSYYDVILMAGSTMLVPYLLAAAYALRLAFGGRGNRALAVSATLIATVYAVWLIYAGGLDYLLMTALFYVVGLAIHAWSRREQRRRVFAGPVEWGLLALLVVAAAIALQGMTSGWLAV